jgi:hypothetical protein
MLFLRMSLRPTRLLMRIPKLYASLSIAKQKLRLATSLVVVKLEGWSRYKLMIMILNGLLR